MQNNIVYVYNGVVWKGCTQLTDSMENYMPIPITAIGNILWTPSLYQTHDDDDDDDDDDDIWHVLELWYWNMVVGFYLFKKYCGLMS